MASNYPPGVTGFEPQIAGYDSSEDIDHREASCQNDECVEFDNMEAGTQCLSTGPTPAPSARQVLTTNVNTKMMDMMVEWKGTHYDSN